MSYISKCFRKIHENDLEKIMGWRMQPDITKYMYTDPQLTLEDQINWYERINKETDSFYRIFEVDGESIGLVNLVDWDRKNSIVRTGGYIAEKQGRSLQNIIDMNMSLYDYVFCELGINKAVFEIMDNNYSQVNWMKRIGATQEGISRQAILKNGVYHDLYVLSFLKEEWEVIRNKIKFNKVLFER